MKFIAAMFLGLTFLAGVTIGTVEIALLNCVVFLVLALLAVRFLTRRFGVQGIVFGMGGAFFASLLWPYLVIFGLSGDDCMGDECLAGPTSGIAAP